MRGPSMLALMKARLSCALLFWAGLLSLGAQSLSNTQPLAIQGDLPAQMVEGIGRYLAQETDQAPAQRKAYWQRDFSSTEAYAKSVELWPAA